MKTLEEIMEEELSSYEEARLLWVELRQKLQGNDKDKLDRLVNLSWSKGFGHDVEGEVSVNGEVWVKSGVYSPTIHYQSFEDGRD